MDSIDEEEFLEDLLITTVSFVVKKGYESWDAEGWAITNDFKLKVCADHLYIRTTSDTPATKSSIVGLPVLPANVIQRSRLLT